MSGPIDEGMHWAIVNTNDPQRWLRLEHEAVMAKLGEDDTTAWMERLYERRRQGEPGS
jgi:hypothetical protein